METIGLFRTRVGKDGSVDIWAKGWRLESQVPALVPLALGVAFLFSPFPFAVRAAGARSCWDAPGSRCGCPGSGSAPTGRDHHQRAVRSRSVPWDRIEGFIGARNEHEGRCVLADADGERLPSPGTLDPDEMDTFWGEGEAVGDRPTQSSSPSICDARSRTGNEPTTAIDLTPPRPSTPIQMGNRRAPAGSVRCESAGR
jgi:hypothetical protein